MNAKEEMFYLMIVCHDGGQDPIKLCNVGSSMEILGPVTPHSFQTGAVLVLTDSFEDGARETLKWAGTRVLVSQRQLGESFGGFVRLTIVYEDSEYTFTDRDSIVDWSRNNGDLFKEIKATVEH
jgi:hypothetical protein